MKALIKNVPGILRVESPPFRLAEYAVNENGDSIIRVRIRFAFDAVRAVKEGQPTVTLTMKSNPSRSYRKPSSPKTMNLKEAARAFNELVSSRRSSALLNIEARTAFTTATKKFTFDLLSAIPDTSIATFRQGLPAQYDYLESTSSQITQQAKPADSARVSDRDYLLSLVTSGIDPASLSENFPLPDPLTGKNDTHAPASFKFYTRRISSLTVTTRRTLVTNFVIFEKDIEISREEFLLLTNYKFEYFGASSKSTTLSTSIVNVRPAEILSQIDSYSESLEQLTQQFERRLDSYFAVFPEPFQPALLGLRSSTTRVPAIIRTQKTLVGGGASHNFSSSITGKVSSPNGRGSKTARQEPDVFPFYVKTSGAEKSVQITKIPPGTTRVEVHARDLSIARGAYQRIATSQVTSVQEQSILIVLPSFNRTYELRLHAYDNKERETLSSNTITCSNRLPYAGAQLNVAFPRSNGSDRSSISIGAEFTDSGRQDLTNLIRQLRSAGISESVISEINNESALYSQIFSYRIETVDLSTGRQTFSSELAPSAGSPTAEYSVVSNDPAGTVINVSLGMKSPDALVPAQPNFRFGQFGGSYRRSQPSAASLSKNKRSGESFDYVDTGISTSIFIPPKNSTGNVVNLIASKTLRSSTLLKWSYNGDLLGVDHFQVFGASGDAECLLGCSFKSLSFEDTVLSGRVGVTRYTVRPVFLDLSTGSPTVVYQKVDSTLPNLLAVTFKSGAIWNLTDSFTELKNFPAAATIAAGNVRRESATESLIVDSSVTIDSGPETSRFVESGRSPMNVSDKPFTSVKKIFAAAAPSSSRSTSRIQSSRSVTRARK